ncbi:hypothetical protein DFA_11780 [Cavenderia fasciculata]|uniref:Uncharacterized protein n=1 Tax=Cavenderia fasciculata TaxID=261658 RepID=F4QE71_CACFS|nr:uncharacterized protein DFA_11780 [Cavenderia fasciculata]EGG14018.1 hypothetical protein DFA_11780 [Cavenderia fasciculata]|eukprot:XP_004350726.1 hypothetical protein DFA_11780 [Cavenderia fasciculata]
MTSTTSTTSSLGMIKEDIIYSTKTYCSRCTLIDRKGLILNDAQVVSRDNKVYLKSLCVHHPSNYTLICSSLEFFNRMSSYNSIELNKSIKDIEDTIISRISSNSSSAPSPFTPQQSLALELNIFQQGTFLTNDQILSNLQYFQSMYPKNRKFVLKIMAKGTNDIVTINSIVIFIANTLKGYPILLEVTVERLGQIGKLPDSSFLLGKVYPALKYFLKRGDEDLFAKDLNALLQVLSQYNGIQAVITIAVERPFANLSSILHLLRSKNELIRFIILSLERPPKDLYQSLQQRVEKDIQAEKQSQPLPTPEQTSQDIINNNDPYELIQEIERATNQTIASSDFFPINVGSALEPMLSLMGYGSFAIRPNPFCGFGTCLMNTDSHTSRPINRLFNIGKFYKEILPILPQIEEKIGFINGLRLKSIIKSCHYDNVLLPNIFDYFTEKSKADITKRVIDKTQILIIHNNMDIASLDLRRRCNCAINTKTKDNNFVSSCTGCI